MAHPEGDQPGGLTWQVRAPDILDASAAHAARLRAGFGAWLDQLRGAAFLTVSRRRPMEGEGSETPSPRTLTVRLRSAGSDSDLAVVDQLAALCGARAAPGEAAAALAEGPWAEAATAIRCGGLWVECLRLTRFPEADVEPGWLWQLVGEDADLDLTLSISPKSAAASERQLRRRLRGVEARALAAEHSGGGAGPELEAAREALNRLRAVLARGEGRLFDVGVALAVGHESRTGAALLRRKLRQRAAAIRAVLSPAWFDELPAMLESMGQRPPPAAARRILDSNELTTCWPWLQGSAEPGAGGYRLGRHRRTGRSVGLDTPGEGAGPNSNCCVIATSGAGKSYLAGLVGLEAAELGLMTVVVDPESEHRGWCEAAGGEYLDLAQDAGLGFNVLEAGDPQEAALAAVQLAELLAGPLATSEAAALLDCLAELIQRQPGRRPRIGDCLADLRGRSEAAGLAARLQPWLCGRPGKLFSAEGRGPVVGTVLGIGLREVPAAWVPGAAWLVSQWLWSWVRQSHGRKQLIVDEAGLLGEHRCLRDLMGQMARRIRKYQGSLLLLTQAAQDLGGDGFGELAAANAATVLLGGQTGPAARRLQLAFDLEDRHRDWLQRARRGEFLLVTGPTRVEVVVEARAERHRQLVAPGGAGAVSGRA